MKNYLSRLLTGTVTLIVCLYASGLTARAQVTVQGASVSIAQAISQIERSSKYTFMYNTADLAGIAPRRMDISGPIDKVLDYILAGSGIQYRISENKITLKRSARKDPAPAGQAGKDRTINVSGTVIDAGDASPVIGAAVRVAGTNLASISDVNGRFALTGVPVSASLEIICMGYRTKTLSLNGQASLTIRLEEDSQLLNDVVIVAFGQQRKVSVTGSLASVGNADLARSNSSNFALAMAGRLPGLNIQQTTGMPGREDVNITLRGLSTYGDASPLILIDGVQREGLSSLDPGEVENVTILKDAASTAVFGVQGANGVILVTTKRGEEGKMELSIRAEQSWQGIAWRNPHIHSWDYAELLNLRNRNSGIAEAFNDWQIEQFRSGSDPVFFPDRDAYQECIKDYAPQTKVNVSARGGTQGLHYFVNASYLHQGGIYKTESPAVLGYDTGFGLDRTNFRANMDYRIASHLKASINLSGYISKIKMIPWTDNMEWVDPDFSHQFVTISVMGGVNRTPPTMPGPWVPAGSVDNLGNELEAGGWVQEAYQYRARLNYAGYVDQTLTTLNTSASLDWDMAPLLKGLSARAMVSYDVNASGWLKASRWYNAYSYHQAKSEEEQSYFFQREWNGNSEYLAEDALWFYPNGGRGQSSTYFLNLQGQINYDRLFSERHHVSAMVLAQRDNWSSNSSASLYLPYNKIYLSARAVYTFDNRYTAEVNLGYNGSEQFAKDKRFGLFPAFSVGYAISEEPFFKRNVDRKWISFLKLRASYGIVGNDRIGDARFLYMDDLQVVSGGVVPTLGRGQTILQGQIGNPYLTWEKARKQNYGLDINFLNGFSFNFDWFSEYRDDILISRSTIPVYQGASLSTLPKANMGIVRNHGFEAVLSYNRQFGNDLTLMVSGNFNFTRNKVIEADEIERASGGRNYVYAYRTTGYPIGQQWGLLIDYGTGNGFINTEEQLAKYKSMYTAGGFVPEPTLGSWAYQDLNGDKKIDDKDQAPIGYSGAYPEITYGASLGLVWRNWDFHLLLQGVARKSGYMAIGGEEDGFFSPWHQHSWTPERYANGEEIQYRKLTNSYPTSNEYSDFLLSDLGFFRVKNIELGYSLPARWARKIGLKQLRISAGCQNLFTVSHLKVKIMDPEQSSISSYPITRNINLGLSVTL